MAGSMGSQEEGHLCLAVAVARWGSVVEERDGGATARLGWRAAAAAARRPPASGGLVFFFFLKTIDLGCLYNRTTQIKV